MASNNTRRTTAPIELKPQTKQETLDEHPHKLQQQYQQSLQQYDGLDSFAESSHSSSASALNHIEITDIFSGKIVTPNASVASEFSNDMFTGVTRVMVKVHNQAADCQHRFEGRKWELEVHVQGKFSQVPSGCVYIAAELEQPPPLSVVSSSIYKAMVALMNRMVVSIHASFGDTTGAERPHVAIPLAVAADKLVVTPKDQPPPLIGEELPETDEARAMRRFSTRPMDMHPGKTYSFSFHSSFVSLDRWQIVNIPYRGEMPLEWLLGGLPLNLVMYTLPDSSPTHLLSKRSLLWGLSIAHTHHTVASQTMSLVVSPRSSVSPSALAMQQPPDDSRLDWQVLPSSSATTSQQPSSSALPTTQAPSSPPHPHSHTHPQHPHHHQQQQQQHQHQQHHHQQQHTLSSFSPRGNNLRLDELSVRGICDIAMSPAGPTAVGWSSLAQSQSSLHASPFIAPPPSPVRPYITDDDIGDLDELSLSFFLPTHFERMPLEVQEYVLSIATCEIAAVDDISMYKRRLVRPTAHFLPDNMHELSCSDQISALQNAVEAQASAVEYKQRQVNNEHRAAERLIRVVRRYLERREYDNGQAKEGSGSGSVWLKRYCWAISVARKFRFGGGGVWRAGRVAAEIGELLSTPLGIRPLRPSEAGLVAHLIDECSECERLETPHSRQLSFPWEAGIRLAADFFGLKCAKLLKEMERSKRIRESIFATMCLFFGLLRAQVIEQNNMDPHDYYTQLGQYEAFGWTSESDPRKATPCFYGPDRMVVSLLSPLCLVKDAVRAAMHVKAEHSTQAFVEYIL